MIGQTAEPTMQACHRESSDIARKERQERVIAHLPLVRKEAQRVARRLPNWVDVDDLVSAGYLGLLSAVDRYDPDRGLSFGAFASHRVKGAILDELRALDPISRRRRRRLRNLEQIKHDLTCELGCPPSAELVADRMGISIDEFHSEEAELMAGAQVSLDSMNVGAGSLRLVDEDKNPPPELAFLHKEMRDRLINCIEHLPEKERTVISLYYHRRLAYREIAELFGVTESRICQIHRAAVERIRALLQTEDLETQPTLH